LPTNPSKPAYDGFGFPTDWVPPMDPNLFAGNPGETSAQHYLDRAEKAATDATDAVQAAFNNLLLEQTDEMALKAAQAKSSGMMKLAVDSLCGAGNAKCDLTTTTRKFPAPDWGFFGPPTCPSSSPALTSAGVTNSVDCIVAKMLKVTESSF